MSNLFDQFVDSHLFHLSDSHHSVFHSVSEPSPRLLRTYHTYSSFSPPPFSFYIFFDLPVSPFLLHILLSPSFLLLLFFSPHASLPLFSRITFNHPQSWHQKPTRGRPSLLPSSLSVSAWLHSPLLKRSSNMTLLKNIQSLQYPRSHLVSKILVLAFKARSKKNERDISMKIGRLSYLIFTITFQ